MPDLIVEVRLVQRPPDALRDPALDLPLDIGGVDRLADILRRDKAQDRHLAGLGIHLDIAELRREAGRHAAGIDRGGGDYRATGQRLLRRQFLERQRREIADIAACRLCRPENGLCYTMAALTPAGCEDKFLTGLMITLEY